MYVCASIILAIFNIGNIFSVEIYFFNNCDVDLSGTWSFCQKTAMIFPFARIFFMYNHFNLLLFETFFSFSAIGLRYLAFYFKGDFLECYICEDHFYSDHRYLRAIFHSNSYSQSSCICKFIFYFHHYIL